MTKKTGAPTPPQPSTGKFTGTRRVLDTDERAGSNTDPALRQPDERDQSADQQVTPPRKVMKQAHNDVESGQQDTDCRNRIAETLPDATKTPENFEEADDVDQAPRVKTERH